MKKICVNEFFEYEKPYSKKKLEDEYKYGKLGCPLTAFQSLSCWTLGNVDTSELEKSTFKVELSKNSIPSFIFNREIPFNEFTASSTLNIYQSYDLDKIEFILQPLNRETAHIKQMCESILKDHENKEKFEVGVHTFVGKNTNEQQDQANIPIIEYDFDLDESGFVLPQKHQDLHSKPEVNQITPAPFVSKLLEERHPNDGTESI